MRIRTMASSASRIRLLSLQRAASSSSFALVSSSSSSNSKKCIRPLSNYAISGSSRGVRITRPSAILAQRQPSLTLPQQQTPQQSFHTSTPIHQKAYPPHELYPMPALSPTMNTGIISKWNVEAGQSFSAGDVLCEIETDKATVDFEAQDDGILAKILHEGGNGQELDVGVPICVIVTEEEDVPPFADFVVEAAASSGVGGGGDEAETIASSAIDATAAATPAVVASGEGPSILMPSARYLSQSKNLDATHLQGTGKGGRVTKEDVIAALESGVVLPPWKTDTAVSTFEPAGATVDLPPAAVSVATPVPSPPVPSPTNVVIPSITTSGTYTDVPNNNMRKVIAKRLTESKSTVPHFYSSVEIELDEILSLRKRLFSQHETKVSVNDIIIKASALALRDVPEVNSAPSKPGDMSRVTVSPTIDVSVAVATPTGLITPIVPSADSMGLSDISSKVRDLALRARDGKLKPEEYQGGSFCVSNLGMFGINEFSAVINPPQAAILAVGGGVERVLVNSPWVDGEEEQVRPRVRSVMTARLSADRRVVDEPTAALFLAAFRSYMSEPQLLLM